MIRTTLQALPAIVFFAALSGCGSDTVGTWDGDGGGDPAAGEDLLPPDTQENLPDPDIPWDDSIDYVPVDDICGEEDMPLQYDVRSDVLIVLDRSGSMVGTLNAVKNAVNTVVAASDDKIWFGLMPFPNSVPPGDCRLVAPLTECAAPTVPHVTLGPNRATDVAAVLADLNFCGSTPTTVTLQNAHGYLLGAGTGHEQYILLATDGVPNCNASLDWTTCTCLDTESGCEDRPEACLDDQACYGALEALLADGIKTYVLGMGSWAGADRDVMNEMAARGGTGSFYPAENPDQILTAFEEIMGAIVVSCQFDLHPTEDVDENEVNLYVGGEKVPRDTSQTNGWDYVDDNTVEFYGEWCDRILSGDVEGVGATFGCPTLMI